MINFFRKIRKKLADDNKPLKYMRYAVGEILLVVLGILIALQINNWNDERKTRANDEIERKEYIQDIYLELQSNILMLENYLKNMQQIKERTEYLLKTIENDSINIENVPKIMDAQRKIFLNMDLRQNTLYDEMRVSGKLGKIKDDYLLVLLEDFYSEYVSVLEQSKTFRITLTEAVDLLMRSAPLVEKYNFYNNHTYSLNFMKKVYHQEQFLKIIRKLFSMSMNSTNASRVKLMAQTILDYVEETYPDILEKEQPTTSFQ